MVQTVDSMEGFVAALNTRDPGDTIKLTVLRGGKTVQLEATLAERSSS